MVAAGKPALVSPVLDTSHSAGEVIKIEDRVPTIDPSSTQQGVTIEEDYVQNVPPPGTSYVGATALNNQYFVPSGSAKDDLGVEQYERIDENPFVTVASQPLSTFSSDVDTASYANVRRFLQDGKLPPADAVRIEELLNYFHYDYPAPKHGDPLSITTEVGPSPWNPAFKLVRIGLRAPEIDDARVPPRNLVFLIDTSGSMDEPNKLPLLVSVDGLARRSTAPAGSRVDRRVRRLGRHRARADSRHQEGCDSRGARRTRRGRLDERRRRHRRGVQARARQLHHRRHQSRDPVHRRRLERRRHRSRQPDATDSKASATTACFSRCSGSAWAISRTRRWRSSPISGNGNYAYIDSLAEARKVLVKQAGATLVTVAKDVKIQVEFNPAHVAGYRLIGYEKRLLRNEDFNDDKKDAGDLGAGHTVTALYEIVPAGQAVPAAKVDTLKYQTPRAATTSSPEMMTIKVRYKAPLGDVSKLMQRTVDDASVALTATSQRLPLGGRGCGLRDDAARLRAARSAAVVERARARGRRRRQGCRRLSRGDAPARRQSQRVATAVSRRRVRR